MNQRVAPIRGHGERIAVLEERDRQVRDRLNGIDSKLTIIYEFFLKFTGVRMVVAGAVVALGSLGGFASAVIAVIKLVH